MPNITIGPLIVDALRPVTDLPLDVHLVRLLPLLMSLCCPVREWLVGGLQARRHTSMMQQSGFLKCNLFPD